MALSRISLSHFRNHRETQIDGARQFNLLVGENGAGKTNVLEAISLLAPGRGLPDREVLSGELPSLHAPPSGCHFRTRCALATDACAREAPAMRPAGPGGHVVACFAAREDAPAR